MLGARPHVRPWGCNEESDPAAAFNELTGKLGEQTSEQSQYREPSASVLPGDIQGAVGDRQGAPTWLDWRGFRLERA